MSEPRCPLLRAEGDMEPVEGLDLHKQSYCNGAIWTE